MKRDRSAFEKKCMQGDFPGALLALPTHLSKEPSTRKLQIRIDRRFLSRAEPLEPNVADPMLKRLIASYRKYYREALLYPEWASSFEEALRSELNILGQESKLFSSAPKSWDQLERKFAAALKARGFYSLFGRVTPFRSILVWQKERAREYSVTLPESEERVRVVHLDGFLELGWMHFASFGRFHVGGWAKEDALFCVYQAYKYRFDSGRFLASYLSHEAQHLSDYRRFPGLPQVDLEFRAKLAELCAAKRPKLLLQKFSREANPGTSQPHPLSAARVIEGIDARSASSIRESALKMLLTHSTGLHEKRIKK